MNPTREMIQEKINEIKEPFKKSGVKLSGRDCAYILAYHRESAEAFSIEGIWDKRVPRDIKDRFKGFSTDKLQDTQVIRDRLLQYGFLHTDDGRTFSLTQKALDFVEVLEGRGPNTRVAEAP
ncbi:hypothetical protein ACG74X_01900 [Marivita sp. S0852]|uniref:hypothetical protein n=1 Tax=Marivita sp. S0852 TaxID=3373893 RepID=UPI00398215B3